MWHRGPDHVVCEASTVEDEHARIEQDRAERRQPDNVSYYSSEFDQLTIDRELAKLGRGSKSTRVVFRGPNGHELAMSEPAAQNFRKPGWVRIGVVPGNEPELVTFRHIDGMTMQMRADRAAFFSKSGWIRLGASAPPVDQFGEELPTLVEVVDHAIDAQERRDADKRARTRAIAKLLRQ